MMPKHFFNALVCTRKGQAKLGSLRMEKTSVNCQKASTWFVNQTLSSSPLLVGPDREKATKEQ